MPGALIETGPELVVSSMVPKRNAALPPKPNEAPAGASKTARRPIVGTGALPEAQLPPSFQLLLPAAPVQTSCAAAGAAAASAAAASSGRAAAVRRGVA